VHLSHAPRRPDDIVLSTDLELARFEEDLEVSPFVGFVHLVVTEESPSSNAARCWMLGQHGGDLALVGDIAAAPAVGPVADDLEGWVVLLGADPGDAGVCCPKVNSDAEIWLQILLNSTQSTRNAVIRSRQVCSISSSGLRDREPLNCGPTARRAAD